MRATAQTALFLLTVIELLLGLLAGSMALASLVTEVVARASSAGSVAFARRARLSPVTPRLRNDVAALLFGATAAPAGGAK